jgi:16S rRNA (cytosine967-C5)-methyltransferase
VAAKDDTRRAEGPTARAIAARVIQRVERDRAFAAAALDAELERYPSLDVRDKALATEIVYGVLRTWGVLLSRLYNLTQRPLTDIVVRSHLVVAAYQLLLLDRVPPHAAVDAAVRAVKEVRGQRVAGFANAVLRKIAASEPLTREAAILASAPSWLLAEMVQSVGYDEAVALLGATEAAPADRMVAVRLVEGRPVPEWLATAQKGQVSPRARLVPRGGNLQRRPGFAEGAFVMQEEGAQVVALALGARPGERVLDACAGRGQKTTLLRELVGPDAELWASDLYDEKLSVLNREMQRLGLRPARTAAVNLAVGTGGLPTGFDRVLVDAPCTGTGTLRHRPEILMRITPEYPTSLADLSEAILRNAAGGGGAGGRGGLCVWLGLTLRHRPEILMRITPEYPTSLADLSEAILRNAAGLARPGGRVVFSVCSVLKEECEAVVARVSDVLEEAPFDAPELSRAALQSALAGEDDDGDANAAFRLLPRRHGTDGFFVQSLQRRALDARG